MYRPSGVFQKNSSKSRWVWPNRHTVHLIYTSTSQWWHTSYGEHLITGITFMLKRMNPEFLQVVLDPPAEGHAAADVPVLGNVVLYKDRSCLRALRKQNDKNSTSNLIIYSNLVSFMQSAILPPLTCGPVLGVGFPAACHCQRYPTTASWHIHHCYYPEGCPNFGRGQWLKPVAPRGGRPQPERASIRCACQNV